MNCYLNYLYEFLYPIHTLTSTSTSSEFLYLKTDSLRLFPPDTPTSDTTTPVNNSKKTPPPLHPIHTPTSTSSEFLYLGTLVSSREPPPPPVQNDAKAPPPPAPTLNYHRLGSTELHPLPPLPRQHSGQMYSNAPPAAAPENQGNENEHDNEEEEFFSPRGSTAANNASPYRTRLSPDAYNGGDAAKANEFNKSRSLNSLNCNSPAYSISPGNRPSVVLNTGSREACNRSLPTAWSASRAHCGGSSLLRRRGSREQSRHFRRSRRRRGGWWHHPGLLPAGFGFLGCRESAACSTAPSARCWDAAPLNGPPELVAPSRKVVVQNVGPEKGSLGNSESKNEENLKPKLKPLHWDKVRASSDRAMVWDQLKSSSFQLNEEMIETYSW